MILKLLRDNGGCRLPCWWGIIPGKTPWNEAHQFLESFTKIEIDNNRYHLDDPLSEQDYRLEYTISKDRALGVGFTIRNGNIVLITVGLINSGYELYQILSNYGKPDSVYLRTTNEPMGDPAPLKPSITSFNTTVVYSQQRILVSYLTFASLKGDRILACPPFNNPVLYLWAKDLEWSDLPIKKAVGFDEDPVFIPKAIQDVTSMNVDDFYNTFRIRTSNACIETVRTVWP